MSSPAALRRLLAAPLLRQGAQLVALHDPLGLALEHEPKGLDPLSALEAGTVLVPQRVFEIARRFDGHSDVAAIGASLGAAGLPPASAQEVLAVAQGFSRRLLLEDESWRRAAAAALARWRAHELRPMRGAGSDYEADVTELRIRVAGIVADDWDMPAPQALEAVIAPACRLAQGARLYGRAYAALRHARELARIVVLAPAGAALDRLLVPLDRGLETPLGRLELDVQALAALDLDPGVEVLAHANSLVLERQALFLRLLFPRTPVLGLLCGALPAVPADGASAPRASLAVESALAALQRVLELPGRTLLVCATDLACAGAGRASALDPLRFDGRALRELDRAAMDAAAALDAEALWSRGLGAPDSARAANLSPLYLLLCLLATRRAPRPELADLGELTGEVLGYQQISSPGALVSAAAAAFHRRSTLEI